MGQNKRVWAEAAVMNRRAREPEIMRQSREAAREGLFTAAAEILRMHVEALVGDENYLFQIICDEEPKHPLDDALERLIEEETSQ